MPDALLDAGDKTMNKVEVTSALLGVECSRRKLTGDKVI